MPEEQQLSNNMEFLFEEALRRRDRLRDSISELRSRTGLLISAASIATAFLGSVAAKGHHGIPGRFYWAIAPFIVSIVLSILLVVPMPRWRFSLDLGAVVSVASAPGKEFKAYITTQLETSSATNQSLLDRMYIVFGLAAVALAFSIVAWIYLIE
jgi:energy-coupling factor transporter transmembrane protein EcfT